jgi:hypothetical protein
MQPISLWVSRFVLEGGGNPTVILDQGEAARATEPTSWVFPFQAELIRSRYALARGEDPSLPLKRAEASLASRLPLQPFDAALVTDLRLLQARWSGQERDWAALETALTSAEQAASSLGREADLLPILDGHLALARYAPGRAEGHLRAARQTLEASRGRENMPRRLLAERKAEILLLEARKAKEPEASLQEGLRAVELALVYDRAGPTAPGRRTRPEPLRWMDPPQQGATLSLKGELLLALAEAARTPGLRRRWALQAHQALVQAVAFNANLSHELRPRLDRARTLATPDHPPIPEPDHPGPRSGTILRMAPAPSPGSHARP